MNINKYLTSQRDMTDERVYKDHAFPMAARIESEDGFSLSVQANHAAYCSPRHNIGPWDEVEVGFPSDIPELIMGYAERPETPTGTVYGYVPVALVEELIQIHGGKKHD